MSAQGRGIAIMALGGLAAALLLLWIPVGMIEMIVASSGISEAWPAAAPPLGLKARLLLAGFAALMVVGMISVTRRGRETADSVDRKNGRNQRAQGARQMGFAFSKLTALARGRVAAPFDQPIEGRAPSLRRADAHPDAPARSPIFASRDFHGLDIFPRPESGRQPVVEPIMPQPDAATAALDPVAQDDAPQPSFQRPSAPVGALEAMLVPAPLHDSPQENVPMAQAATTPAPVTDPTHGLTIAQLTERLERGLSQRNRTPGTSAPAMPVIADMPVAAPVAVRDSVAPDADDALRAALGALRTMAGRAR